jgi:hypothetical protein
MLNEREAAFANARIKGPAPLARWRHSGSGSMVMRLPAFQDAGAGPVGIMAHRRAGTAPSG